MNCEYVLVTVFTLALILELLPSPSYAISRWYKSDVLESPSGPNANLESSLIFTRVPYTNRDATITATTISLLAVCLWFLSGIDPIWWIQWRTR